MALGTVPRPYVPVVSPTASSVHDVVRSLDWPHSPELVLPPPEAARLVGVLGEGATRWVAGAVEQAIEEAQRAGGADLMAPWDRVRWRLQRTVADCLVRMVAGDVPVEPDDTGRDAVVIQDIVGRDVDLPTLTALVRTLQHALLQLFLVHALRRPEGAAAASQGVRILTSTLDGWVDDLIVDVVAERQRALESTYTRRRAVVQALLAGNAVDTGAASTLLGVPLAGWHVACVVGAAVGSTVESSSVARVAASLVRAVGGGTVLQHESSTGQVALWVCAERPGRAPEPAGLEIPPPLVVGVGRAHSGPSGLRRTYVEASDAMRLARRSATSPLRYVDVALAATLNQDEERARWYVEHTLGELAGPDHDMVTLRATLRAFFATRMRVAPTAELLFLHRNTLISRLDRVERLLGHRVSERTAEVQAALLLSELPADSPAARTE